MQQLNHYVCGYSIWEHMYMYLSHLLHYVCGYSIIMGTHVHVHYVCGYI